MRDRVHTPDLAEAPDPGPLPAPAADLGLATALLQHLQANGRLTPSDAAAALQRFPQLREAVLHVVAAHWGIRGVQALVDAEAQLHSAHAAATAPAVSPGPAATQATAPAHTPAARQIAERDALNAVITVVARGPDGAVLARWRARGRWVGPLPARYHGSRAAATWTWSDPAARDTRLHTRADGTGGVLVEVWAAQHGATTVDVMASAIDDAASDDEASAAHDPATSADPAAAQGSTAGNDSATDDLLAALDAEPDQDAEEDGVGGEGKPGGDPQGRTGDDTAVGGTGPGGPTARAGGDQEGSETRGAIESSHLGSALGVEGGLEGGRLGGEGKPGDDGVTMGGGIIGVITVPEALKGAVDVILIADSGDITGAGASAFKQLGKETARLSAAEVRKVLAHEAREAAEKELRATLQKVIRTPKWRALPAAERKRAVRIAYNELQRKFFQGFGKAAKDAERTAQRVLRRSVGLDRALAQESADAARVGAEAAEVEPVAGRLPRNHQFAGKEFPREQLPPKYREKGLKFKKTGYPDFEPYALELPNGKKTVKIELTGSRRADYAVADRAAKLEERPEGYMWHHVEDEGTMMLVPTALHETVSHTGGSAVFKDRTGIGTYGD